MIYGLCNLFGKKKQPVVRLKPVAIERYLKPVAIPRCKICLSKKRLTMHKPLDTKCNNDEHRVCFHCLDKIKVYCEYWEECIFCYYEQNQIK